MSKLHRVATAAASALAFSLLINPSTATAAGEGYIDADPGLNNGYENDWNDEGPLGQSNYPTSNAVGLWQWILWSDGYLRYVSDIDCVFGSGTASATRQWNLDKSFDTLHSSRAEQQSFTNADNGLRFGGSYNSTLQYVYYGSSARPVTFLRGKSDHGAYYFKNPATGSWLSAVYSNGEKANACG
ncbi:hypothetical protein [Streptomyces parvulus]|uniref:Tat pathway signal protein n=1 Tax=Streptomyces parvulus TaxID=146923 RepID=A0A369UWF8_9ACTN|nr:hypothetical protein [Streptomyces parvulus]RDD85104.1 hypothetical protein DVZ84_31745 [Streptomyces parvulus]